MKYYAIYWSRNPLQDDYSSMVFMSTDKAKALKRYKALIMDDDLEMYFLDKALTELNNLENYMTATGFNKYYKKITKLKDAITPKYNQSYIDNNGIYWLIEYSTEAGEIVDTRTIDLQEIF